MTHDIDTYWTHHSILGEGQIERSTALIRLKLHRSDEQYSYSLTHELFPLSSRRGKRVYFHAKPYILIPDITLTVALSPTPAQDGAIGEVVGSDMKKLKPLKIGNAQAWYYPAEKALVLWECFLESRFSQHADPQEDKTLHTLWTGFERLLLEHLHPVERIYTTFEPIYERPVFAKFLETQGYQQCGPVAFVKAVPSSNA